MVFTTNTYINKSTILNERLKIKDEIMTVQNAFKQNYSKKIFGNVLLSSIKLKALNVIITIM